MGRRRSDHLQHHATGQFRNGVGLSRCNQQLFEEFNRVEQRLGAHSLGQQIGSRTHQVERKAFVLVRHASRFQSHSEVGRRIDRREVQLRLLRNDGGRRLRIRSAVVPSSGARSSQRTRTSHGLEHDRGRTVGHGAFHDHTGVAEFVDSSSTAAAGDVGAQRNETE